MEQTVANSAEITKINENKPLLNTSQQIEENDTQLKYEEADVVRADNSNAIIDGEETQDSSSENNVTSLDRDKPKSKGNSLWVILSSFVIIGVLICVYFLQRQSTKFLTKSGNIGAAAMQEKTTLSEQIITKTSAVTNTPTIQKTFATYPPIKASFYPSEKITTRNASNISQLVRIGNGTIEEIAYSPDGSIIAVATSIGIFLYDSKMLQVQSYFAEDIYIDSIAFSPDGQVLASGSWDGTGRLWNAANGSMLDTLEGHTNYVLSVAFAPDGRVLASGSDDGTVRLWQVADGRLLNTLEGHASGVNSLAFSPDGQVLTSGSWDGTIRLWQAADGRLLNTLEGHTSGVKSVAFSHDGQVLASWSSDGTLRLWGTP